jgi:hypothetical protein
LSIRQSITASNLDFPPPIHHSDCGAKYDAADRTAHPTRTVMHADWFDAMLAWPQLGLARIIQNMKPPPENLWAI